MSALAPWSVATGPVARGARRSVPSSGYASSEGGEWPEPRSCGEESEREGGAEDEDEAAVNYYGGSQQAVAQATALQHLAPSLRLPIPLPESADERKTLEDEEDFDDNASVVSWADQVKNPKHAKRRRKNRKKLVTNSDRGVWHDQMCVEWYETGRCRNEEQCRRDHGPPGEMLHRMMLNRIAYFQPEEDTETVSARVMHRREKTSLPMIDPDNGADVWPSYGRFWCAKCYHGWTSGWNWLRRDNKYWHPVYKQQCQKCGDWMGCHDWEWRKCFWCGHFFYLCDCRPVKMLGERRTPSHDPCERCENQSFTCPELRERCDLCELTRLRCKCSCVQCRKSRFVCRCERARFEAPAQSVQSRRY